MDRERAAGAHAPTGAAGPRHDGRSIGELLRDADHLARTLLMDLTAQDAPGLLRSWDRLVDAAAAAWTAIDRVGTNPAVQPPPGRDPDPMLRLHAVTEGIATTLDSARWPGPGPGSTVVEEISDNIDRVTDLLERSAVELPRHRPDIQSDVAAAQMRLMHTVYLSAHAVTSSLQQHGRQLRHGEQRPAQLANPGPPYAAGPTGRWVQRIGVCEGIAGHYVRGTAGGFAAAVAGEVMPRPEDPGRLHHELARWDVQVHRSLAADPSPHNLVLASRTQAFIAATALPLLTAAHHAGLVAGEDLQPLTNAVETSGDAWNQLASRWADLAPTSSRADSDLTRAAAHLRAAARELTHSPKGKPTATDIVERVDIVRALGSVQHALAAAVGVAHLTRDPAANPDLTGPARPLSIRAHNDTETANARQPYGGDAEDVLWVTPQDVFANKAVPLPRPVADNLALAARHVVSAAASATAATTPFGPFGHLADGNGTRARVQEPGRRTPTPPSESLNQCTSTPSRNCPTR